MKIAVSITSILLFAVLQSTLGAPPVENTAKTTASPSTCPRYPTRYEGNALIVEIEKGKCEMIISAVNMHRQNAENVQSFRKRVKTVLKKINLPKVSYRSLMSISEVGSITTQNPTTGAPVSDSNTVAEIKPCTTIGYRFVGPVLVIDTVLGECQMMIVAHMGRKQGEEWLSRLNRKGKPRKQKKNIMFEYIDEPFF